MRRQTVCLEIKVADLLSTQAERLGVTTSDLAGEYLREKIIAEEFEGVAFRDASEGREACILGHRIAVWEVADVFMETGSIERTADHFGLLDQIVRNAIAYARAFPKEVAANRQAEVTR